MSTNVIEGRVLSRAELNVILARGFDRFNPGDVIDVWTTLPFLLAAFDRIAKKATNLEKEYG
jgi:hypothetical protein